MVKLSFIRGSPSPPMQGDEIKQIKLKNMETEKLRKKLLKWHYNKRRSIKIIDLLQSNYQCFRCRVQNRLELINLDFREAIKKADENELWDLMQTIDEERLGI